MKADVPPGGQGRKVAIVTGGSRGIGAALVAGYRRSGWAVVASSRAIEQSADPDILTVRADVSDPDAAGLIVSRTLEEFGRIDTLINNAGVFVSKPFTDYTAEDYALAVSVNLTGFFWLTQRVISEMLRHGGGHVVNITSTLADYASSNTPSVLTSLTKGALASATRSLAIEYAARGIRVNAVAPASSRPRRTSRRATARSRGSTPSAEWARSGTSSTASCSWSHRRSSRARFCTSTVARGPVDERADAFTSRGSRGRLGAALLANHVVGVPVGPVLVRLPGSLLVLAVAGCSTSKRRRKIRTGGEGRFSAVDAAR
jgi:NAD(P)-dependent dehydrogenase (short-subunit alcohol dehydrogenase family)